jgi:hypothetical protein
MAHVFMCSRARRRLSVIKQKPTAQRRLVKGTTVALSRFE